MNGTIQWLSDNKTWVFSGLAFFVLGTVGGVVKWLFGRKSEPGRTISVNNSGSIGLSTVAAGDIHQTIHNHPPVPVAADESLNEYRETPTGNEIRKRIFGLPILQQPSAWKYYIGLRVRWPTTIKSVHEITNPAGFVRVRLRYGTSDTGTVIYVEVELQKYPWLLDIHGDEHALVTGTIVDTQYECFIVDVLRFELLD